MLLRELALLLILLLSSHSQILSQTKCKGLRIGPGRGGGGGGGSSRNHSLPVIKVKPQPKYTKEALRRKVQGKVTLLVVFHSSGQVRDVCVIQGLPYGLTKRAVEQLIGSSLSLL